VRHGNQISTVEVLKNIALTDCFKVCDKGSDFGPHLHYQRPEFMDKSTEFIVQAFKGTPLAAKASVPAIKDVKCAGGSPAETITVSCPKTTPAPEGP
jgi:hypothetical protein